MCRSPTFGRRPNFLLRYPRTNSQKATVCMHDILGRHPQYRCRPIGTSEKKCRMVPCVNIQACWRESCLLSERLPNPLCRAAGSSGEAFHTCRHNGRRTTRPGLNGKSPQRIDFENNTSCWPALRVKRHQRFLSADLRTLRCLNVTYKPPGRGGVAFHLRQSCDKPF